MTDTTTDTNTRTGNRRLTSGRVGVALGVVALTISLGVPSEAAKVINGKSLKNNSVTTQKIKNNNLTGKDVKNDSLTGKDVKESSLQGVLKSGDVAAFGNATSTSINDFTSPVFTSLVATSFSAPRDGVLYITGAVSAEDDSSLAGPGQLLYRLSVDGSSLSDGVLSPRARLPRGQRRRRLGRGHRRGAGHQGCPHRVPRRSGGRQRQLHHRP